MESPRGKKVYPGSTSLSLNIAPVCSPKGGRRPFTALDVGGGAGGPLSPGGRRAMLEHKQPRRSTRAVRQAEQPTPRKAGRGFVRPPAEPTRDVLMHGHKGGCSVDVDEPVQSSSQVEAKLERGPGGIGLTVDSRLCVTDVVKGSSAESAGLRRGMRLAAVNGHTVGSQDDAIEAVRLAGDSVHVSMEQARPAVGKLVRSSASARQSNLGSLGPYLNEGTPSPPLPPAGDGLPGVGPRHTWSVDAEQWGRAASSPSVRRRIADVAQKPNVQSPATTASNVSRGGGRRNKTSYQLAVEDGHVADDGSWPMRESRGRMHSHAPCNGNITRYDPAHPMPSERTARWKEHSPRRGRLTVVQHPVARSAPPGHGDDAADGRKGLYPDAGKRRSHSPSVLSTGSFMHWDGPPPAPRPRSLTPDRTRCSWSTYGDITSWRRQNDGNPPDPLTTGHRLRCYHQGKPAVEVDKQPQRAFVPGLRHQRPLPEPTTLLNHDHRAPVESPRSGRRMTAMDPQSPGRTNSSHGVWSCLRTE